MSRCFDKTATVAIALLLLCTIPGPALAGEEPEERAKPLAAPAPILPEGKSDGLTRLDPDDEIWLDRKRRRVVINGAVAIQQGQLEMFACLKGTKEHESVVSVRTKAFVAHAALLALGAKPGGPVRFFPEYRPAHGTEIEITVYWKDARGRVHTARAQEWIRDVKTGKAMRYPFVFGGSGFWVDKKTGQRFYQAEDGDFICISNFASAMLDVPVESSQSNEGLLFDAFTEHIPRQGTEVTITLVPKVKKEREKEKAEGKEPEEAR